MRLCPRIPRRSRCGTSSWQAVGALGELALCTAPVLDKRKIGLTATTKMRMLVTTHGRSSCHAEARCVLASAAVQRRACCAAAADQVRREESKTACFEADLRLLQPLAAPRGVVCRKLRSSTRISLASVPRPLSAMPNRARPRKSTSLV
jgi:hypothetical protein